MLLVGAFAQISAIAQSGRGVPAPHPQPTPTPETSQSEAKRSRVTGENADIYRLVFPTRPGINSFSEQLNKAGEEGYKLISVIYRWQRKSTSPKVPYAVPVAILKFDEVQHQYAFFETISNTVFTINGFEQRYRELSRQGFHLADYFLISASCEYRDPDNSALGQDCESKHLFLLERTKGDERPKQFILARSLPPPPFHLKTSPGSELTGQIKDRLANGFYPSAIFSKWEILLTQTDNRDEFLADNSEVQFLTSAFRNDVKKRVNELAQQGYQLALVNKQAAVMYHRGEKATPLTYIWLKVSDKNFDEQILRLQEDGGIYRMTYTDNQDVKDQLVFEQSGVPDGPRREYKVLSFESQVVQNEAIMRKPSNMDDVYIDLTPASKNTLKALNSLAKEGFRVRDLFVSDIVSNKVGVLLERDIPKISTMPN